VSDTPTETVYPAAYYALRAKLAIDPDDLDNEIAQMPVLVQDAAELAVAAANEENACQLAYDVIKAETGHRLRRDNEKITEAAIERAMPLYEEVQEARIAYNYAKTYTKLCDDLVRSLRTKVTMLQKHTEMIMQGYITPSSLYEKRREEINAARRASS
jgi:hypothetical protein